MNTSFQESFVPTRNSDTISPRFVVRDSKLNRQSLTVKLSSLLLRNDYAIIQDNDIRFKDVLDFGKCKDGKELGLKFEYLESVFRPHDLKSPRPSYDVNEAESVLKPTMITMV